MHVELAIKDLKIFQPRVKAARDFAVEPYVKAERICVDLVLDARSVSALKFLAAPGNRAEHRARGSKRFERGGAILFDKTVSGIERRYHATKGWRRTRVAPV